MIGALPVTWITIAVTLWLLAAAALFVVPAAVKSGKKTAKTRKTSPKKTTYRKR